MDIAGIMRLLENIARTGTVTEVDLVKWRVRVQSGDLVTDWLRWNAQRAGNFEIWIPPSPGEQVWLLCIGGNVDTAIIGGSLYSNDYPAPGAAVREMVVTAPDGAKFRYDADAGALQVTGIKSATIEAAVKVTLSTPVVECTQHLKARTMELTDGGTMKGDVIHTGGSLSSNGKVLHTHRHPGDSGGTTGAPI
ncbi:phage baseplate assembly protein V [Pluralibacter gergoviae]|nr:phage baseplate assembly protein V [Pluralibacter gergoviae]